MDDAQTRFDRWIQEFGEQHTRRGLGTLAVGVLVAMGFAEAAGAKGKKGKKGKKKKLNGPGACCIDNDVALVSGDKPEQCCKGSHVYDGRCALPPGHTCYQDSFSLCWDGSRCNGNRCPEA